MNGLIVFAQVSEAAQLITLGIAVLGLGGLIFTALKFNRDDTTSILTQQDTIVGEMRLLNEELRTSTSSLREERDSLKLQVDRLTKEIDALRATLHDDEMDRGT